MHLIVRGHLAYAHRADPVFHFSMGVIGRTSGLLAALALFIVSVAVVGESAAERDPMVRRGRSASHRLDTLDDVAHAHDVTASDATTAGLTLGQVARARSATPQQPRRGASQAANIPSSEARGVPDVRAVSLRCLGNVPLSDAGVPPTPGRAPPIA